VVLFSFAVAPVRLLIVREKELAMASGDTVQDRSLYERDYYTWALGQARALREHHPEELDWENLAEELEGLVKTERRELRNRLRVLLEHLLKWQFQPRRRSLGWRATIAVQRIEIQQHLDENPGLKPSIPEVLRGAYATARVAVTTRFLATAEPQPPESCPSTFEQVMDEQFWPE